VTAPCELTGATWRRTEPAAHAYGACARRDDVTTIICARNAAATIARAVASALPQCGRVLLVDDWSTDDTVTRARAAGAIDVVVPASHGSLGMVRQCGLDAVTTPYLVWLDADDEFLPDRVPRLVAGLERERSDIAADGVELVDGLTGESRGYAEIPLFVRRAPIRLFERMYLPGPGVIAARTTAARAIGYDPSLHGSEDTDLLLRALAAGARLTLGQEIGYRLYAYPDSLSRRRENQRTMYRRVLHKHPYNLVADWYAAAAVRPILTTWALVSIALFREDYEAALEFINRAEALSGASSEIVEPDGPCPYPEYWRIWFARGTTLLLRGDTRESVAGLRQALAGLRTPETLNNLGVALARIGDRTASDEQFAQALALRPGYADPRVNLASSAPTRITTHPLRVELARQDYHGTHAAPS
jgi:glycosyltransferase involved in cell wall biosynthesis